jgi:hypothetical protein
MEDNNSPELDAFDQLYETFFEFEGLSISGPEDVAGEFVEDLGILCDKLTKLRDALRWLTAASPRLENAAEHALSLHRVAVRACGGRIVEKIEGDGGGEDTR